MLTKQNPSPRSLIPSPYLGIISNGRRCESCGWGCCGCCNGTVGWGKTGLTSVVLGLIGAFLAVVVAFLGAAAFFLTVFFTGLRLLVVFFAVFGMDFLEIEGFLPFTGTFFAGSFFFAAVFGAAFLVSFFMASPFSCNCDVCDYIIFFSGWK
jgi:hypothetical protein